MKTIAIVGAGFSGLTLAYFLQRKGVPCEVFESSDRIGGLISSHRLSDGLVESAANGLLWSPLVQEVFDDLKIEMLWPQAESRNRWIYHQEPRRWPLSILATLKMASCLPSFMFKRFSLKPYKQESVQSYILRLANKEVLDYLVAPALQGIYAGDPEHLSASLIFGPLFSSPRMKEFAQGKDFSRTSREAVQVGSRKKRGTVAPKYGMGELLAALAADLNKNNVLVHRGKPIKDINELKGFSKKILCCPMKEAGVLLKGSVDKNPFAKIETVPLISTTVFFPKGQRPLKGFGCLFPRAEGFEHLGVLFNDCIFANRSIYHSDTWILGGAQNLSCKNLSETEVLIKVSEEQKKLYKTPIDALESKVFIWQEAIPHYTLELEQALERLSLPPEILLHGNFMGYLGLGKILQQGYKIAQQIKQE